MDIHNTRNTSAPHQSKCRSLLIFFIINGHITYKLSSTGGVWNRKVKQQEILFDNKAVTED